MKRYEVIIVLKMEIEAEDVIELEEKTEGIVDTDDLDVKEATYSFRQI